MKEEENELLSINFETLSRKEIVQKFTEVLSDHEVQGIISIINDIETAYEEKSAQRDQEAFKKFRDSGGYPADFVSPKDEVDSKFKEILNVFKDRLGKYKTQKKEKENRNLKDKEQIIEDLKNLIQEEDKVGKAFQQFTGLNNKWKSIGAVQAKKSRQLNSDYHFQIERFYYNININKDLKELDLEKHLEEKSSLLDNIEALLKEKTIKKVEAQISIYHEQWSNIGPVPKLQNQKIIKKFNDINDQVFEKIRQHYKDLTAKQKENLEAKVALCDKVEKINELDIDKHGKWKTKTDEIINIQKEEWPKIGRVPREENQRIWERFRTACDIFFQKKKDFYDLLKKGYSANEEKKTELCEAAEELKDDKDWENSKPRLIKLQRDWKGIGPAGPKQDQKLWLRFRSACDFYFEAKKNHDVGLEEQKIEQLKKKQEMIKRLNDITLTGDADKDLATLKVFSSEWDKVGDVPRKEAHKITEAYTKLLDEKYEQLPGM